MAIYLWVFDYISILDIFTSDTDQISVFCTIGSDKLSNDGKWFGGINFEFWSRSIVFVVSQTPWAEVTSILVADTVISLEKQDIDSIKFGFCVFVNLSNDKINDKA